MCGASNFVTDMSKQLVIKAEQKGGKAVVYIRGVISEWNRTNSIAFEQVCDDLIAKGITDLTCYINSPGGNPIEANQIGITLNRFPGKKTLIIEAMAASAATMFLPSFDHRECYSNSQGMIHEPQGFFMGKVEEIEANVKSLKLLRTQMVKDYAAILKKSEDEIAAMIKEDYWMDAEEMLSLGIVHKIRTSAADVAPEDAQEVVKMYASAPESLRLAAQAQPKIDTSKNSDMEKLILLASALGLKPDAKEEDIIVAAQAAIGERNTLQAKVNDLQGQLNAKEKAEKDAAKARAITAIATAKRENKLTPEMESNLTAQADKDPAFVETFCASLQPHVPASSRTTGDPEEDEAHKGWTFEDFRKKDPKALEAMKTNDLDRFKKLFKAEFGTEYKA